MWAWVSLLPWSEVLWQGAPSQWGGGCLCRHTRKDGLGAGFCCPCTAQGPSGPCPGTESCRVPSCRDCGPLQEGPVTDPGVHRCLNGGSVLPGCTWRSYLSSVWATCRDRCSGDCALGAMTGRSPGLRVSQACSCCPPSPWCARGWTSLGLLTSVGPSLGRGISIEGSGVVTPQDSSGALPSA